MTTVRGAFSAAIAILRPLPAIASSMLVLSVITAAIAAPLGSASIIRPRAATKARPSSKSKTPGRQRHIRPRYGLAELGVGSPKTSRAARATIPRRRSRAAYRQFCAGASPLAGHKEATLRGGRDAARGSRHSVRAPLESWVLTCKGRGTYPYIGYLDPRKERRPAVH